MGWYYEHGDTRPALVARLRQGAECWEDMGSHLWVVDRIRGGHELAGQRIVVCYLLDNARIGYKPVSEDMGPLNYDCPLHFLALARAPDGSDPDFGPFSRSFRAKVRCYSEYLSKGYQPDDAATMAEATVEGDELPLPFHAAEGRLTP